MIVADWQPIGGHSIDWGSAAAWVGSVLSATSVLLALSIIFRDRRLAERKQAMALSAVAVNEAGPGDAMTYYVNLHNASDSVIVQPGIIALPKAPFRSELSALSAYMRLPSTEDLGPGVKPVTAWLLYPTRSAQIKLVLKATHEHYTYVLEFGDGKGNRWQRDMETAKLRKKKIAKPPEP